MSRRRVFIALGIAAVFLSVGLWALRNRTAEAPSTPVSPLSSDNASLHTSAHASLPASVHAPSPPALTLRTAEQLAVLDQIFATRNDNDPRLDTELRKLDENAKLAFRARYLALPPEKRNERGTIVFLLGRNLTSSPDYAFLKEVLLEPPCLSPLDCSKAMESDPNEADHQGGSIAILLAYPQLTALKALERSLSARDQPRELRSSALDALNAARSSRSAAVSQLAERIRAGAER